MGWPSADTSGTMAWGRGRRGLLYITSGKEETEERQCAYGEWFSYPLRCPLIVLIVWQNAAFSLGVEWSREEAVPRSQSYMQYSLIFVSQEVCSVFTYFKYGLL